MNASGKKSLFLVFTLLLLFLFSLAADRGLALFGVGPEPAGVLNPVAPPHYETRVDTIEFAYDLRTNSRGLRSAEVPVQKPDGRLRVVLLGDSFTEGHGVPDAERWGDLLERRLREEAGLPVDVVNCGESGTRPLEYLLTLQALCADYEPDLVVVGLYANDVSATPPDEDVDAEIARRLRPERTGLKGVAHALWPHVYSLLSDASAALRSRESNDPSRFLEDAEAAAPGRGVSREKFERWRAALPHDVVEHVRTGRLKPSVVLFPLFRPGNFTEAYGLADDEARGKFSGMTAALARIRTAGREIGAETVFAFFPSVLQIDPEAERRLAVRLYNLVGDPIDPAWSEGETPLERALDDWALGAGVDYRNLTPAFREAGNDPPAYYEYDMHWTPRGHRIAADALYPLVEARLRERQSRK